MKFLLASLYLPLFLSINASPLQSADLTSISLQNLTANGFPLLLPNIAHCTYGSTARFAPTFLACRSAADSLINAARAAGKYTTQQTWSSVDPNPDYKTPWQIQYSAYWQGTCKLTIHTFRAWETEAMSVERLDTALNNAVEGLIPLCLGDRYKQATGGTVVVDEKLVVQVAGTD